MDLILKNNTANPIELTQLGFTIPASNYYDMTPKSRTAISRSTELQNHISNATLSLVRVLDPETLWTTTEALDILKYGVNADLLGLGGQAIQNNLTANRVPTELDDAAHGYSIGSLWIFQQRVWSCADSTTNAAIWSELTQPATHPGVVNNRYYSTEIDATLTTGSVAANILYAIPCRYPAGTNWTRIGIEVTTASSASNIRLGIYSNANGGPGELRLDAGTVSGATTGAKEVVIDYTNQNDWFWIVCVLNKAITLRSINSADGNAVFGRVTTSDAGIRRVQATYSYNALPTTFPSYSVTTSNPPFIWVRKV